jgi:hypothetical protein
MHGQLLALLPGLLRNGDELLLQERWKARRADSIQAHDGLRGDLPHVGAFHAYELAAPRARLPRMRRDLGRMRGDCERIGGMEDCVKAA